MSRRKKHEEHVNHERWLVSYADFITLLFAFFVVMFASSQVDKRKVGKVALAIQVAFQEMGIFEVSNTQAPLSVSEPMPYSQVQMVENVERSSAVGPTLNPTSGAPGAAGGNSARLQAELEKQLAPELQRKEINVHRSREGLVISLREIGFFESGSAQLRPGSQETLKKIAGVLQGRAEFMRIEGHTDSIPIHTARFASNWELSTARATEIIRLFITEYGFAPENLAAAGYAEYHPVAPNDTPQNRAQNRRVDVVVLSLRPPIAPGPPRVEPVAPRVVEEGKHK